VICESYVGAISESFAGDDSERIWHQTFERQALIKWLEAAKHNELQASGSRARHPPPYKEAFVKLYPHNLLVKRGPLLDALAVSISKSSPGINEYESDIPTNTGLFERLEKCGGKKMGPRPSEVQKKVKAPPTSRTTRMQLQLESLRALPGSVMRSVHSFPVQVPRRRMRRSRTPDTSLDRIRQFLLDTSSSLINRRPVGLNLDLKPDLRN
jgi:hypothetical protein